jgi:hypothetical protein
LWIEPGRSSGLCLVRLTFPSACGGQWLEELPAIFNDNYSYGDSAGFTPASLFNDDGVNQIQRKCRVVELNAKEILGISF